MAFSDNLTPQDADNCSVLNIDFDARCANDLVAIAKRAARQRASALIAALSALPGDQQTQIIQSNQDSVSQFVAQAANAQSIKG